MNVLPFIRDPAERAEDMRDRRLLLRALEDAQDAIRTAPLDRDVDALPEVLALRAVVADVGSRHPQDVRTATGPGGPR